MLIFPDESIYDGGFVNDMPSGYGYFKIKFIYKDVS